jgi:hypothetical protein
VDLRVARRIDIRLDGVIGQSFLRQAPYLIDYREKSLWLGDEAVRRSEGLPVIVALASNSDGAIVPVTFAADQRSWRLRLDSGASDLVLACGSSCPKIQRTESTEILTNHGTTTGLRAVIGELRIGGARFGTHEALLVEPIGLGCDGVLPARWFAAVYVDSANHVVRLAPAK